MSTLQVNVGGLLSGNDCRILFIEKYGCSYYDQSCRFGLDKHLQLFIRHEKGSPETAGSLVPLLVHGRFGITQDGRYY
jgi:hypothetical protein